MLLEQQKLGMHSFRNRCDELGEAHKVLPALSYGTYQELQLTTTKYAFARGDLIVTVNNADHPDAFDIRVTDLWDAGRWNSGSDAAGLIRQSEDENAGGPAYIGVLSGKRTAIHDGWVHLEIDPSDGEIWVPAGC